MSFLDIYQIENYYFKPQVLHNSTELKSMWNQCKFKRKTKLPTIYLTFLVQTESYYLTS